MEKDMTPVEHNPNCAIVRSGDIRAWCDCGAEIPVMNEIRANVSETIGAGKERERMRTQIANRIAALRYRETVCWNMAGVFMSAKDAHGLHDMGVEIQGIQWAIRELEPLVEADDDEEDE
jgi:hypothetical protein